MAMEKHGRRQQLVPAGLHLLLFALVAAAACCLQGALPVAAVRLGRSDREGAGISPLLLRVQHANGNPICHACRQLADKIEDWLEDPETASLIITTLEDGVCSQMETPELQKKCDDLMEEFVPKIIDGVESDVSEETLCVDSHICKAEAGTALVTSPWEEEGGNDPEDCLACLLVVKVIKKKLHNPATQAKIKKAILSACDSLTKSNLCAECKDAVDEYLPIIFANIDKLLDAKKLCTLGGFCKSRVA